MITLLNQCFKYKDGHLYWKLRGKGYHPTRPVGSINKGYRWITSGIFDKQIAVHRAIWMIMEGPIPEGYVIDHINRNSLDNRIENLRCVTQSTNCANTLGKCTKKGNLPKGVYECVGPDKFRFQVCREGRTICKSSLSYEDACNEALKFFKQDISFVKQ